MINEKKKSGKKDACYHKVKSRYSVWPSAYASGALVKCRKKGAKNWGKGRKDEALCNAYFNFGLQLIDERTRRTRKQKIRTQQRRAAGKESQDSPETLVTPVKQPSVADQVRTRIKNTQERIKALQAQRAAKKAERDTENLRREREKRVRRGRKSFKVGQAVGKTAQAIKKDVIAKPKTSSFADDDEAEAYIQKKRENEYISQAAARGTTRKKTKFRKVTGPDGKPSVQAVSQGLTTRVDGKILPRFNKAAFTRTGDQSKGKAIVRGIAGTLPGRTARAQAERLMDKGALRTIGSRAVSSFQRGRASMRRPKQTSYAEHVEYQRIGSILAEASAAWTRSEGKNPSGGLNAKGVASYRAQNPGSKLKTAVTTKPSKLKKGSKAAKRRKSFCARMKGMRKRQKSSNNTGKDRLSLSLKKWNC